MKINKLILENVKGVTGEVELKGVNVVTGSNRTGKTGIIDGFKLACLGEHPDKSIGKMPGKIMASLGSGAQLRASVIFHRHGDSNILNSVEVSPKGSGFTKSMNLDVEGLNPFVFQSGLFLDQTKDARNKMIWNYCGIEIGDNVEKIIRGISNSEIDDDVLSEMLTGFEEKFTKLKAKSQETCVDGFSDFITDERKEYKRLLTTSKKTIQGIVILSDEEVGALNPEAKGMLGESNQKLGALNSEIKKLSGDNETLKARREEIGKQLHDLLGIEECNLTSEQVDEKIEFYSKATELIEELAGQISDSEQNLKSHTERTSTLENAIETSEMEIDEFSVDISVIKNGECPCCGQSVSDERSKGKIESLEKRSKDRSVMVTDKKEEIKKLDTEFSLIEENIEAIKVRFNSAKESIVDVNIEELEKVKAGLESIKGSESVKAEASKALQLIGENSEAISSKEEARETLGREIEKLSEDIEAFNSHSENEKLKLKSEDLGKEAAGQIEVCNGVIDQVKEWFDISVQTKITNLLAPINESIFSLVGITLNYADGDFYYFKEGGVRVNHSSFSGAEKLMLYTGLSIMLATGNAYKVVVLDEMAKFDSMLKAHFYKRIIELQENGTIDQFIAVDHSPSPVVGLNIINASNVFKTVA